METNKIEIGVYQDGAWYLDYDGSGTWNAGDRANGFGAPGWTPVVGNWNGDATGTKIGVYQDGTWYLDNDGSGTWNAGDRVNGFGAPGGTPVVGNWNGDATGTKIGVYQNGTWYLDNDGSGNVECRGPGEWFWSTHVDTRCRGMVSSNLHRFTGYHQYQSNFNVWKRCINDDYRDEFPAGL